MKVTNLQLVAFCAAYRKLEDVVLDNDRGMAAAEAYTQIFPRAQAFQLRQSALLKERARLVRDHAKKNGKGEPVFANTSDPDPANRPLVWANPKVAEAAFAAWSVKADALDAQLVTIAGPPPIPATFFERPTKLTIANSVRTGFLPFMAPRTR